MRISFKKDFDKLERPLFHTIRLSDKGLKEGDVVEIHSPSHKFKAEVLKIHEKYLEDLSDWFLSQDTGLKSREEAIKLLQRFYPGLKEIDKVTVIWLHQGLKNGTQGSKLFPKQCL